MMAHPCETGIALATLALVDGPTARHMLRRQGVLGGEVLRRLSPRRVRLRALATHRRECPACREVVQ